MIFGRKSSPLSHIAEVTLDIGVLNRMKETKRAQATDSEASLVAIAIFDLQAMKRHFRDNDQILRGFVDSYMLHVPTMINDIKTALDTSNSKDLQRSALKLRGITAKFFAQKVQSRLQTLESLGKTNQIENAAESFDLFKEDLEELHSELEKTFLKGV